MRDCVLVSIIVPVYNIEQYLKQCMDSLINQTLPNIEIICVNDGSPDKSADILDKYAKNDERIHFVTQTNQGLSGARNKGLKLARGKYIMFVDSDDWIDLDTCEQAVTAAEKYSADLVLWSYIREFENESREKYMFWDHETVFDKEQVKKQLHRRICGLVGEELRHPDNANAIETAWGKLYLTERIRDNHVEFAETKAIGTEDALFNLYVFGYIQKAVYLRKCFNHYRKTNQGSLTKTYNQYLFSRWQRLFDYMERYISDNQLGGDYLEATNNRIALSILGLGLNVVGADKSAKWKVEEIRRIISHPRYKKAYKNMEYSYLTPRWKVFFYSAAKGHAVSVFVLISFIRKMIYG